VFGINYNIVFNQPTALGSSINCFIDMCVAVICVSSLLAYTIAHVLLKVNHYFVLFLYFLKMNFSVYRTCFVLVCQNCNFFSCLVISFSKHILIAQEGIAIWISNVFEN